MQLHIAGWSENAYSAIWEGNGGSMNQQKSQINPIERSLLNDLKGLYTCDLKRERHARPHKRCYACRKKAIVIAIARYQQMDRESRATSDSWDVRDGGDRGRLVET